MWKTSVTRRSHVERPARERAMDYRPSVLRARVAFLDLAEKLMN